GDLAVPNQPQQNNHDNTTKIMQKLFIAAILLLLPTWAFAQTPATLAQISNSGILRVCTPGDYRPFSFLEDDGNYEGLDVDLMQNLADTLDAKLQFVKTSWADLMDDFTAGKCDVGAGGISVTLARQKQAWFSAPYMINGKTPITLCTNVDKYQIVT